MKLADDVDLEMVSQQIHGFVGAILLSCALKQLYNVLGTRWILLILKMK